MTKNFELNANNDVVVQTVKKRLSIASKKSMSNYLYPEGYKLKEISKQIKIITKIFDLDGSQAIQFAQNLPKLPRKAEGWFAIPKVSSIVQRYFPTGLISDIQYYEALKIVFQKISERRKFFNHYEKHLLPHRIRQHPRTVSFLEQLESEQQGDILILAIQFGMRYQNKTVRRTRKLFADNEFGLGAFHVGCMSLIDPERFLNYFELDVDCSGDELAFREDFSNVPIFFIADGRFNFGGRSIKEIRECYGTVSAFIPKS